MEKQKYTWHEMCEILRKFNADRGYTCKGTPEHLTAVAVITQDSFSIEYPVESRSYVFTSDNKAFIADQCSNSIFSRCLDGTDNGVRLDWYIPHDWKVEYCYLMEE